jgi:DNA-binding PadR family transcriptional regulator
MAKRYGRHTPAFLLLQLLDAPAYGGMLMKKLENEVPYCFSDSAMIYRSLKDMEESGLIESIWKTKENGQPIKWYNITTKGLEILDEFAEDIQKRYANFEYFLSKYHSEKFNSNK